MDQPSAEKTIFGIKVLPAYDCKRKFSVFSKKPHPVTGFGWDQFVAIQMCDSNKSCALRSEWSQAQTQMKLYGLMQRPTGVRFGGSWQEWRTILTNPWLSWLCVAQKNWFCTFFSNLYAYTSMFWTRFMRRESVTEVLEILLSMNFWKHISRVVKALCHSSALRKCVSDPVILLANLSQIL